MRKNCPYCDANEMMLIANTNIRIACGFCVKGHISADPKERDARLRQPGLLTRFFAFLGIEVTP